MARSCKSTHAAAGNEDVEYLKICDCYLPPSFLRLYEGPLGNVEGVWRILGRDVSRDPDGNIVVGTINNSNLDLQPRLALKASLAGWWQCGDLDDAEKLPGSDPVTQMPACLPEVRESMEACVRETGQARRFLDSSADDPVEQAARAKYILSQLGSLSDSCASLVDVYSDPDLLRAPSTADSSSSRSYRRSGRASSPEAQREYTAFVHTKISRIIEASTTPADKANLGQVLSEASEQYPEEWQGVAENTPIISSGMNALRLPALFEQLGHSNVILTDGGGAFLHKDGPTPGAIACRQSEEAWKAWKAGTYGHRSLSDGVIEFAKTHEELRGAFETFQEDADGIYPGWRRKLVGSRAIRPAAQTPNSLAASSAAAAAAAPDAPTREAEALGLASLAALGDGWAFQVAKVPYDLCISPCCMNRL